MERIDRKIGVISQEIGKEKRDNRKPQIHKQINFIKKFSVLSYHSQALASLSLFIFLIRKVIKTANHIMAMVESISMYFQEQFKLRPVQTNIIHLKQHCFFYVFLSTLGRGFGIGNNH